MIDRGLLLYTTWKAPLGLEVPVVELPADLWDRLNIDEMARRLGWCAYRALIPAGSTFDAKPSASSVPPPVDAVFGFCPMRALETSAWLCDVEFDRYVESVARLVRFMYVHQDIGDRVEQQRVAESDLYDADPYALKVLTEVQWRCLA